MSDSSSDLEISDQDLDQLAPNDTWIVWLERYNAQIDNAQIVNIGRQLRALSDDFGDSQRMRLLFIRQMESIANGLAVLFSFLICMGLIGRVLLLLVWILYLLVQSIEPVVSRAMDSLIISIVWSLFLGSVLATIFGRRPVLAIIIIIFGSIYIYIYIYFY